MGNRSSLLIYLSVITAVILWGISFAWSNSLLINGLPALTLIFLRMSLAALILTTISLILKKLKKISLKDLPTFILLSFLEPFLYFIGETFGLQYINSVTISSVIISTIPVFAMIAGILFLRENISPMNIFGILITIPGALLVVFEKGGFDVSHSIGILFLILAVFSAVGYSVIVKKLADRYNSYTIVTYQHLLAAFYFLPLFLIFEGKTFTFIKISSSEIILPLTALALLCSSLAFILFINSIRYLGVAKSNIFTALVPAISAAASYFLGNEGMTYTKFAGVLIVIIGVIIAQKKQRISSSLKVESSPS